MGILTSGANADEKENFSPASSFIELVEYDPENRTMDITFRSGSKIRYVDVFQNTFLSFKQSPTHSAFYARAIKGNLQSVKIISNDIGTQKASPLKTITKEQPLDTGLRKQIARTERIAGTVARAFGESAAAA